ncbi:NADH-quinone oxidoreductase subunit NuoE [Solimonas marina]|uniref:NADH-quinone oxidoreductase subunit E n=1 Tax=Solimonas marina TaxID=2714601 RepID=A0A970B991_9GAMM|nr:NADH-quinone oxidoreductase subunit NuoE [Solimonas marina]NKF22176.1 NADH-quinone oxidoreductase subunit NuoE [Solimonas marina]
MSTPETVVKLAELTGKTQEAPFVLTDDERHEIEHEIAHYPDARAASIGALKIIQARRGWVPDGALEPVAKMLGIGAAELEGVATFYSLIYRKPVGRHVVKVCDSITCFMVGYEDIKKTLEQHLGITHGQTTADGRFTMLPICCIGACDKGPALMVDDDLHHDLTPDNVVGIVEAYK